MVMRDARNIVHWIGLGGMLLLLGACALAQPRDPVLQPQAAPGAEWWAARFQIYWPQGAGPDMAVDHLFAHAVVAPVLKQHQSRIHLWRFHRRAAPDGAGHQFSFLFYTDAASARLVLKDIETHPVTRAQLVAGFLQRLRLNSRNYPELERVAATSDPNWTASMQHNWPVYIQGVSALWLGLIDANLPPAPARETAAQMLSRYRVAAERVTAQWRGEGMHALIHHLSAVFGYVPLPLGEQEVRF